MTRIDGALISAVKYFRPKSEHTEDHPLSSVHYKLTFGVLLGCAILSGLTSWYSPIECSRPSGAEFEMSYVKQWCYANSSYVVKGADPREEIHRGVSNLASNSENVPVFISFYQWVTLCLLIQAASFQIPRILWKAVEGGRIRKVVEQFHGLEFAERDERIERVTALARRLHYRQPDETVRFFQAFVVCQILYLVNICLQISLTQSFLSGNFISLVPKWLSNRPVLDIVFPKASKCDVVSFGSGGGVQRQDILCILPMNVLHEKIYLLVWCMFMFALVTAVMQLIYIALTTLSWRLRYTILRIDGNIEHFLHNGEPVISQGEWLVLKFVKDNLDDGNLFDDLVYEFANCRKQPAGSPC